MNSSLAVVHETDEGDTTSMTAATELSSVAWTSVQQRLVSVKKAVEKATEEALQRTDPQSDQILENADPNASFHLGMELFGSEPAQVEQTIQEKLTGIEKQLRAVRDAMDAEMDVSNAVPNEVAPDQIAFDANVLKFKINFLRQCSQIRQLLEEATTLSDASLAASAEKETDLKAAMEKILAADDQWKRSNQSIVNHSQQSKTLMSSEAAAEIAKVQHMLQLMRQDMLQLKTRILSNCQSLWHNCVTLEQETIHVRGFKNPPQRAHSDTVEPSDPPLHQVYDVLQLIAEQQNHSFLQEILLTFADRLFDDIIHPVLKNHVSESAGKNLQVGPVSWQFHETEDRGSSMTSLSVVTSSVSIATDKEGGVHVKGGAVRTLEWAREEDKTTEKDPILAWTETIRFVERILVFVADYVLLSRSDLCNVFGTRLFGKATGAISNELKLHELGLSSFRLGNDNGILMGSLCDIMRESCIPDYVGPGELSGLCDDQSQLKSIIRPFLRKMEEKGLLLDGSQSALSQFVDDFLQKYIENRHSIKLDEARTLILTNDYHNTIEVGEDVHAMQKEDKKLGLDDGMGVFLLHKSSISDTAYNLMKLSRSSMDEALQYASVLASSDPAFSDLPATLYQAARQVLDLYRAIVPVSYGKEVSEVPRTAAIFYNDCVYFAHNCLSMGVFYRERFAAAMPQDKDNSLSKICIFVDKVPLFREMADRCMREMLDKQAVEVQQLVAPRIDLLHKALRSEEIATEWADAEEALNSAVYHLKHLAQNWKPVLSYDVFHSVMGFLADVLFRLFSDKILEVKDFSGDACQFVHQLFGKALGSVLELMEGDVEAVRTWKRFESIGLFMDMTMSDIEGALSNGVFSSVTGQELTMLINAAFDQSPRQDALLRLLSSSS